MGPLTTLPKDAPLQGERSAGRLQLLAQSGEKACSEQEPVRAQEGVPWGNISAHPDPHETPPVGTLLPLHRPSLLSFPAQHHFLLSITQFLHPGAPPCDKCPQHSLYTT